MVLLFIDETNNQPREGVKFFICGGLFCSEDSFKRIDDGINALRKRYTFQPTDILKFDTNTRPKHLTAEQATEVKAKVIDLCLENNARFAACLTHHSVVTEKQDQQFFWAVNTVLAVFNQHLRSINEWGICFVDNLPTKQSQYKYFVEKFCEGLKIPSGKTFPLERIRTYGATCNNASNLSSAADVVLGAFRFCVNNPAKAVTEAMMVKVAKMMHHRNILGQRVIKEHGFMLRPKQIQAPQYQKEYEELRAHLNTLVMAGQNQKPIV